MNILHKYNTMRSLESNFYILFFSIPHFPGSALFVHNEGKILPTMEARIRLSSHWNSLLDRVYSIRIRYPIWRLVPFKTKYALLVILWFAFSAAYCLQSLLEKLQKYPHIHRRMWHAIVSYVILFVFINHLFVY